MGQYDWLIGAGLAVVASVISNLGVNLQKLTHVREQERQDEEALVTKPIMSEERAGDSESGRSRSNSNVSGAQISLSRKKSIVEYEKSNFYSKPLWMLGLSLVILGSIADFAALGYASQIIVAPLGATTLVSNIWFAPYFSGEVLTRRDLIATATIIGGSIVSVAFANHDDKAYTFDEIFAYYEDPRFFFYMMMLVLFVFFVWKMVDSMEVAMKRHQDAETVPLKLQLQQQEEVSLIERLASYDWGRDVLLQVTRFVFAAISGIAGAQSVMFAKGVASLVHIGLWRVFTHWPSYFVLAGMFTSIYLQIKWLNHGLQHFDALYVIPVFQAFWIGFSVIAGMIVYHESEEMSWLQLGLFTVGVSITLTGVYVLSGRASNSRVLKSPAVAEDDPSLKLTQYSSTDPAAPSGGNV